VKIYFLEFQNLEGPLFSQCARASKILIRHWCCWSIMFACSPSMCVCVRPGCCFCDICGMRRWIFTKHLSVVHWETKMNSLGLKVKRSNVKVTVWPYMLKNHYISGMHRQIFSELLSLVHRRTKINWLGFGAKRSKVTVIGSHCTSNSNHLVEYCFFTNISLIFFTF